jgi:hypothetical protein
MSIMRSRIRSAEELNLVKPGIVWVVTEGVDRDYEEVLGVFESEAKAIAAANAHYSNWCGESRVLRPWGSAREPFMYRPWRDDGRYYVIKNFDVQ